MIIIIGPPGLVTRPNTLIVEEKCTYMRNLIHPHLQYLHKVWMMKSLEYICFLVELFSALVIHESLYSNHNLTSPSALVNIAKIATTNPDTQINVIPVYLPFISV